jgi:hypothetical protein
VYVVIQLAGFVTVTGSGKLGQSCYTIRRTILESGRQELAGDSV